ncbi:GDSL-type esterase/lipase family protein [Lacticaseibacillus brantae]|uniref:SGNH hydrolase-type esterase domain-containing protein n=1 Tax=Lacticaseibacillus brantae DSM 23927 TaxID=1423727 RepID=A0A0R2B7L7_9LACO|nr:GDSL-type esterase/lipase family protein [Lacticaseibacillus brantae]KRM72086.1 hypothetical protein FC34_GL001070 [Lacticaseibacillus brantae DSM 23927]
MAKETTDLTDLNPEIKAFQNSLRMKYDQQNTSAEKGQIVFVGSSLMEIFPIEKMQQEQDLGLTKTIYNRGVRATTTADLLAHMDTLIFDLQPSKIFINIGSNDVGFNVPEETFLSNYTKILEQIKTKLPNTRVYAMAFYPVNTTHNFGEEEDEHSHLYEHRSNELLEDASEKVKRIVEKAGDTFINVNDGLTDSTGNLKPEYTFDGAHMLPNGYQVVFNNMKPYLD